MTIHCSGLVERVTSIRRSGIFYIIKPSAALSHRALFVGLQVFDGKQGFSLGIILLVEILPNARGALIVDFCLRLGYSAITMGVLGFLGLGLPPPTPDWGGMVNEGRTMAFAFPHLVLFPCLALSSLVLGLSLLADGLRQPAARLRRVA